MQRITADELTALAKQCNSWTGWQIAEELGLSYSGDSNPIDHGGVYYETRNWLPYGYASAVELYPMEERQGSSYRAPIEELLLVMGGTINRPDDADGMRSALDTIGMREEWEEMREMGRNDPNNYLGLIHLEIEACRAYMGIEPSGSGSDEKIYKVATWRKEWRLWRSMLPLLLSLQEG
jgi:hypothetical protein